METRVSAPRGISVLTAAGAHRRLSAGKLASAAGASPRRPLFTAAWASLGPSDCVQEQASRESGSECTWFLKA